MPVIMTRRTDITRFAPSPTGYLHLGHGFSALFAAAEAGDAGLFLLRIEDIDASRCRPPLTAAIIKDLAWLGLTWPQPVLHQSQRMALYAKALDQLHSLGLLYPCFCSRSDIQREIQAAAHAPHGPDGPLYPGTCRTLPTAVAAARIAAGDPHAWRLDIHKALTTAPRLFWHDRDHGRQTATPEMFGDVILARRDTPASYHLAVTLDDAAQGVTCVTRGQDLFDATHIHRLLQHLLDLPVPEWRHHRLLTDANGQRLAKRDGAPALRLLREEGHSAADLRQQLGFSTSGPVALVSV